jgi:hypothetical protein
MTGAAELAEYPGKHTLTTPNHASPQITMITFAATMNQPQLVKQLVESQVPAFAKDKLLAMDRDANPETILRSRTFSVLPVL